MGKVIGANRTRRLLVHRRVFWPLNYDHHRETDGRLNRPCDDLAWI